MEKNPTIILAMCIILGLIWIGLIILLIRWKRSLQLIIAVIFLGFILISTPLCVTMPTVQAFAMSLIKPASHPFAEVDPGETFSPVTSEATYTLEIKPTNKTANTAVHTIAASLPQAASTIAFTNTPLPTYTQQPTYTPYPTYTPLPPPPTQPPHPTQPPSQPSPPPSSSGEVEFTSVSITPLEPICGGEDLVISVTVSDPSKVNYIMVAYRLYKDEITTDPYYLPNLAYKGGNTYSLTHDVCSLPHVPGWSTAAMSLQIIMITTSDQRIKNFPSSIFVDF